MRTAWPKDTKEHVGHDLQSQSCSAPEWEDCRSSVNFIMKRRFCLFSHSLLLLLFPDFVLRSCCLVLLSLKSASPPNVPIVGIFPNSPQRLCGRVFLALQPSFQQRKCSGGAVFHYCHAQLKLLYGPFTMRSRESESPDTRALWAWNWCPNLEDIVEERTLYAFHSIRTWERMFDRENSSRPKASLGILASWPIQLFGWSLMSTVGALAEAATLLMSFWVMTGPSKRGMIKSKSHWILLYGSPA